MQNVDFSKKKTKPSGLKPQTKSNPRIEKPKVESKTGGSLFDLLQQRNSSIPGMYLLLGSILLFTAGFILGMKTSQNETLFSNNQSLAFKNINPDIEQDQPPLKSVESDSTQDKEDTKQTPLPYNLQYPPKPNQMNYIIQLGSFTKEEATKQGASLIREKQEFQGRIFRTTTGKLYVGFFYSKKDAKVMLNKVKKFQDGIFSDASIKNIEF